MEPVVIRTATLWDLFWIEALGRRGLDEAGQLYPAYDLGHMLKGFIDSIEKGLAYVAVAKGDEGERIIGALIVGIISWPQSPRDQMVTNEHLYVLPEYRARKVADGRLVGIALIDILRDMANRACVPAVFRATFGTEPEAIGKLAERSGFRTIGGTYIYEPKPDAEEKAA